jgi:S-adenosylmethionine decarboxylase proenzyme
MHGLHLTADLRGVDPALALMTSPDALRERCVSAVAHAGLSGVAQLFHRFTPAAGEAGPAGITGVVLLAESHLAVHTWPELGGVTLDVYVCNLGTDNSGRAEAVMGQLLQAFSPLQVQRGRVERGLVAKWARP